MTPAPIITVGTFVSPTHNEWLSEAEKSKRTMNSAVKEMCCMFAEAEMVKMGRRRRIPRFGVRCGIMLAMLQIHHGVFAMAR